MKNDNIIENIKDEINPYIDKYVEFLAKKFPEHSKYIKANVKKNFYMSIFEIIDFNFSDKEIENDIMNHYFLSPEIDENPEVDEDGMLKQILSRRDVEKYARPVIDIFIKYNRLANE